MPDITFDCPHCQNHIEVDERGAGMRVTCPHCAQSIVIPGGLKVAEPSPAVTEVSTQASGSKGRSIPVVVGAVILLLALSAGGFYFLRDRSKPTGPTAPKKAEAATAEATPKVPPSPSILQPAIPEPSLTLHPPPKVEPPAKVEPRPASKPVQQAAVGQASAPAVKTDNEGEGKDKMVSDEKRNPNTPIILEGIFERDGEAYSFEADGYIVEIIFVNPGIVKLGDGWYKMGKALAAGGYEMSLWGSKGVMRLIEDEKGINGGKPVGFIFELDGNQSKYINVNKAHFLKQLDRVGGKLDFRKEDKREWRPSPLTPRRPSPF